MDNKKYITQIKNGRIIFWSPLIIPLFLWCFFLYKFFDFSNKTISFKNNYNSATSLMLIFFFVFTIFICIKNNNKSPLL